MKNLALEEKKWFFKNITETDFRQGLEVFMIKYAKKMSSRQVNKFHLNDKVPTMLIRQLKKHKIVDNRLKLVQENTTVERLLKVLRA